MKPFYIKASFRILFSVLIVSNSFSAKACDLCGCLSTGGQMGVLPQFSRSFLSFRYHQLRFSHLNIPETQTNAGRVETDVWNQMDIWGRWVFNEKTQLMVNVPYVWKERIETNRQQMLSGIGDIQFTINQQLLKRIWENGWQGQWNAGLSIQLPTGKYRQRDYRKVVFPLGMQAGSGAYAFPMFTQFGIRHNKWGLLSELMATYFTENEDGYRMGFYKQASATAIYYHSSTKTLVTPLIGFRFENNGLDKSPESVENPHSGSSRMVLQTGGDVYWGNWSSGLRVQLPVRASYSGYQPRWDYALSIHVLRFF